MYTKNSFMRVKIFLRGFIALLFLSLSVFLSSGGNLKADEPESSAPQASSVLASTDGEFPDLRVEVKELKRTSGDTVTIKFALINDSDKEFFLGEKLGGLSYGYNVSGVNLVDAAGKKKYLVIMDSEKKCLCSTIEGHLQPKSRINVYAKFPAPPENVEKITVDIPHFIPMEDVPISQ